MASRFLLAFATALLVILPSRAQSPENWGQRVDYDMDITLHADDHQYTGEQTLTYTNNSPDTLTTVYYHLYFNAFHPESMMAERNRQLPDPDGRIVPRIFRLDSEEQGWHRIRSLRQDGQSVEYKITDTVMRVDLAEPILPGESTTFEMQWTAQVPLQTRRSGRDSRGDRIDFTMTQWFPKMAAYDERGWHANFYVNREYYAPFGTFDVEITLPTEYTIGATGVLQNPEAIGHGYNIDGNGTWRPSDGLPEADSLTWHFTAENVHNFAWSADPDYIHDKVTADGTTHHILYKPSVAEQWTPLKDDMPDLTAYFSQEYGDYPYPQMTVAQGGDGGMEYPMFTVVSSYDGPAFEQKSSRRSVLGTTVHEFAHMWYYAALGSNEADYAWMDEGFTSYATAEGMAHLTGGSASHSPTSLVWLHKQGLYESFSTPADWFKTNTAYGVASYPGGELVVDMLGYVMGEQNRDAWLKRYLRQREYQNPDPFDLELFAEQESGLMLDWYFWQFTRSTRTLDDEIDNLENTRSGSGYEASFTLEREGTIRMPHDVKLTLEDGSTQWVNVPLATMHGHKPVPDDWIVAEPWPWVYPKKRFTVEVPSPAVSATLDPNERTPDVNRLNNSTDFPLRTRFLHAPESNWSQYELGLRPLALYAHDFGFGGGLQARGQYFLGDHRLRTSVTLWPEVLFSGGDDPRLAPSRPFDFAEDDQTGSWFDGIDYELRYEHPLPLVSPRATFQVSAEKHQGVLENRISIGTPLTSPLADTNQQLRLALLQQLNPSDRVFGLYRSTIQLRDPQGLPIGTSTYLINPWGQSHTASARIDYSVTNGRDWISAFAEAGGSFTGYGGTQLSGPAPLDNATRASLQAQKTASLGALTGEAALQLSVGTDGLLPHKRFRLGGSSVEAEWRNDTYRQGSASFEQPVSDAHLVGFSPAGPVAYLQSDGFRSSGLSGQSVIGGRLSLGGTPFPSVNPLSPLQLSVFSGAGTVWNDITINPEHDSGEWVADAGLGARYDLSSIPHLDRWTAQSDFLQELDVVAKFPVWASDPGLLESGQDEFKFRWLIGIEL
ncbi:aminopeptidase [Salinibacter sp. 10B]|uniref:M1 family metallopeptidase n=1 Tax=Salinibacter sp. 10B TaxID=1923971 RepID=UPI000CF4C7A7|nr:M1 family metallopeptidase [Salinibacter sp. 10B]PQJ36580.1 aminopeptidase [Salinibacter sp. 10B]